jgi:hypothetical protein
LKKSNVEESKKKKIVKLDFKKIEESQKRRNVEDSKKKRRHVLQKLEDSKKKRRHVLQKL